MPIDNRSCGCAICSLKLDFAIDAHLLGELEKHNCVIFAGSGVSTETSGAHPDTLYDTLRADTKAAEGAEFWDLVDLFQAQPNGRQKFIELVRDRFSYIDSFRGLRWNATRFHRELGNAPYFKAIITTNWDRYFEDVIGATPFVYDSDIPFWESARRPVIKIHGSIDNYSSIVASSEDYKLCEHRLREGALGAVVKQIFATKTCIFCGYSARDQDFRRIFETIRQGLGPFARAHYLISPFISEDEALAVKDELGITAIKTDAAHFISTVKTHMSGKFCFSRDVVFARIADEAAAFREHHQAFVGSYNPKHSPHLIYATAYQDGLLHAYERILDRAMCGEFADLHEVQARIRGYESKISEYKKLRSYWDLAYFTGYQNGLLQFVILHTEEADIPGAPLYFHPGQGEMDEDEFNELVRPKPDIHKAALKEAQRRTALLEDGSNLIVTHPPWG